MFRVQNYCLLFLLTQAFALNSLAVHRASAEFRSYHIGNSLTWDSQPGSMELYANEFGNPHRAGYHIHNSWPLKAFIADPNNVTVEPAEFGKYSEALANHQWDAITLQPHFTQESTLEDDVSSILTFIDIVRSNPLNSNTVFYIYEAWPSRIEPGIQEKWTAPVSAGENPYTTLSRDYFDLLYESVSQETNAEIRTIPVGEVVYQLDLDMRQGLVPGFNFVHEIYKDHIHLNNELGRYVASATTFATLSGVSPLPLYKPPGFIQKNLFPLSQEVYDSVNSVIRDVLNADPHSGVYYPVTDFDNSGVVGTKDLRLWENSYPGLQYDLDGDGMVSGLDFLQWQTQAGKVFLDFDDSPANLDGLGLVDTEDLLIWEQAYGIDNRADLDGDGDSDGLDFLALQVEFTPFQSADINRDRHVDGVDLDIWEASFGYSGVVDADGDMRATGLDFLIWQQEVSQAISPIQPSARAVPEPTTAMLFFGSIILSFMKR